MFKHVITNNTAKHDTIYLFTLTRGVEIFLINVAFFSLMTS